MYQTILKEFDLGALLDVEKLGGLSADNNWVRTTSGQYVLKRFPEAERARVERISGIYAGLNKLDIPCPEMILSRDGKPEVSMDRSIYLILTYHPGSIVHDPTDLYSRTSLLIDVLSDLHHKLAAASSDAMAHVLKTSFVLSDEEPLYYHGDRETQKRVRELRKVKLGLADRIVSRHAISDEQAVVHGDLHNENVVFRPDSSSVIFLDWERARFGMQAEDAATFSLFAFCNSSFADAGLHRLWSFMSAYGVKAGLDPMQLETGIRATLLRLLRSSFIEQLCMRSPSRLSMSLLVRDEHRFGALAQSPALLARLTEYGHA
jgi:Ser/Thr protein kinase RdoA (MazF antagonist)